MRPKTRSSRGAVELPLTYLYAVLIGIVVFIIATRVIGVQGQSADEANTQLLLEALDTLISGAAQNPNVIQPIESRADIRFAWDGQARIIIGKRSTPLAIALFSQERLGQGISAWTYPYRVERASSPLLFLSDGTITYRVVNLTSAASASRGDIIRETPANAAAHGLTLIPATNPSIDQNDRDLCIKEDDGLWSGCEIRFRSDRAPYGYLSWDEAMWYPVVSYGEIFAALFAASEDEWLDAITTPQARDRINREVLIERAELFESAGFRTECVELYEGAIGNLTETNTTITALDSITEVATIELDVFEPIPSAIENLTSLDRQLTRYDCPVVIR
jgi:hypothetical protein